MILVNCKLYEKTLGKEVLRLVEACAGVQEKTKIKIGCVVSPIWLRDACEILPGGVWLGHVDEYDVGAKTGYVSPLSAALAGAEGSLLNHSEHSLPLGTVMATIARARMSQLKIMVCTKSLGQSEKFLKLGKMDFLAYEPPELIGSSTESVADTKLSTLSRVIAMAKVKGVGVMAGAGIKSQRDVEAVVMAGGVGILVSSAVVLANDWEKELLALAKGFKV